MRESEHIEHEGYIESIDGQTINIRIVNQSACSACHANGACSAADLQDKIVEIKTPEANQYSIMQKVIIVGKAQQGFKAVLFAYALPTALVIISMLITYSITNNDVLSGIVALGILIPYFTVISLLKKRLQKTFSFTIKSI